MEIEQSQELNKSEEDLQVHKRGTIVSLKSHPYIDNLHDDTIDTKYINSKIIFSGDTQIVVSTYGRSGSSNRQ